MPGTLTVGIKNTINGDPFGAVICSGTFDGDSLTTDPAGDLAEISMSAPCSLSAGTRYAIVLVVPDGSFGKDILVWRSGSIDGYAGGERKDSLDAGQTWVANPTIDFYFENWGLPA